MTAEPSQADRERADSIVRNAKDAQGNRLIDEHNTYGHYHLAKAIAQALAEARAEGRAEGRIEERSDAGFEAPDHRLGR